MTREGLARLAFEAWFNASRGEGGWDEWTAMDPNGLDAWLKVGLLIESMLEDARPSGRKPEPAKVIVVTETGSGERVIEKRFAGAYEPGDFGLLVIRRDGREVARYQQHAWHSVHEDGAIVPDSNVRALGIAKKALSEIVRRADDKGEQPFGRPEIGGIAADALNDIWTETEL